MKSVSEVARMSGVSVRTLHYYDSIGLLSPSVRNGAGYRFYGDSEIAKLKSIMLLRELGFSLDDIKTILSRKDYDTNTALENQIKLLTLQRERIDRLISLANSMINGEKIMDFDAFNTDGIDNYKEEVKMRWGNTKEYREYKEKNPTDDKFSGLMEKFAGFGKIKDLPVSDSTVQNKVAELKSYITDNFYTCSKKILLSLGEMYTEDERFRKNIDTAGGVGTASFVGEAIKYFCK